MSILRKMMKETKDFYEVTAISTKGAENQRKNSRKGLFF